MPELPEVQTITKDLGNTIVGYTITKCTVAPGYIILPTNDTFRNVVMNKRIINVERIAKNILIHLEDKHFIHFHLAMTGQILLKEFEEIPSTGWMRVMLRLEEDFKDKYLMFNDMRMFGKIAVIGVRERENLIKKYGPEPIDEDLDAETFLKKLKTKNTTIKNALLDQTLVSGLGNIYATDALYLAGVNPEQKTKDITEQQSIKLLEASKQILLEGIKHRGSTLPDKMYVDIFGKKGTHQEHFKIYSKEVCPKCNTKVVVKKINGRGTYFCPKCQPLHKPLVQQNNLIRHNASI